MFFKRELSKVFPRYTKFPVVAILGPRQSGKTTLARKYFNRHRYINLENPEFRAFATEDPNRFLREFENDYGIILDEFQYVPELLSFIQIQVDEKNRPGYFILTGSQNFLMNERITQSLAGRVGILTLLPFSLHELKANNLIANVDLTLFNGSYPRVYESQIEAIDFYPSYIHTYLERDVRQITQVGDILLFQKFMRLCAARIGQQINFTDLATYLAVDLRKIKQWISVLENSFIIFLLKPHFQNFNKRITKTPKLYFYDTGLACSLLDIKTKENLALSSFRGNLFESLIISDFYKQYFNSGISNPSLYFWRDQNGRIEVDCILDRGDVLIPIEIKSGETILPSFFNALSDWQKISGNLQDQGILVYGGDKNQTRSHTKIVGWQQSTHLVNELYKI